MVDELVLVIEETIIRNGSAAVVTTTNAIANGHMVLARSDICEAQVPIVPFIGMQARSRNVIFVATRLIMVVEVVVSVTITPIPARFFKMVPAAQGTDNVIHVLFDLGKVADEEAITGEHEAVTV